MRAKQVGRPGLSRRLALAFRRAAGWRAGEEGIDHSGHRPPQDRRDPEEPELLESPAVGKDGRGGAARRVEGEIGDRDPGPIDQGHGQADGQRREALRRPAVRRAQNDQEEKKGEHRFGAETGQEGIAPRGVVAVAIGSEAAGDEAGPPGGDEIEHPGAQDPADHLGGNVAGDLMRGEPLAEHEAHRDGGVDMAARDMAKGVHDRDHGHSEGERDADDPDAELWKAGAQERAPTAGKHQPERAKRFSGESLPHRASLNSVDRPRTMPGSAPKRKQSGRKLAGDSSIHLEE